MSPQERQAIVLDHLRRAGRALYRDDFNGLGLSSRQVYYALEALEDLGFIARMKQAVQEGRSNFCYFLMMEGRQ